MARLEMLKDLMKTTEDMRSVVKTMKSLAAARIRQYQIARSGLMKYDSTIEKAFALLLRGNRIAQPDRSRTKETSCGLVVFGSDQGLVGQFNGQTARFAHQAIRSLETGSRPPEICVIGNRLIRDLEGMGYEIGYKLAMPVSVTTASLQLRQIFLVLAEWRQKGKLDRILLVYNSLIGPAVAKPVMTELLPPDKGWIESLQKETLLRGAGPVINMKKERLFGVLVDHYIYSGLFRGLMDSLTSENAVRLSAMQLAEIHIEEYLDEITMAFNQERQTQITEELLDIIGGSEALFSSPDKHDFA
jgi:F-type H+-transporting ATPase subunit gamma